MPQQMSYVPPAYGAGYGAAPQQPYMNEATIKQQYTHQKELLEAECLRNITMAKNQFEQQRDQALMSLEQQKMSTLYSNTAGAGTSKGATKDATTTKGTKKA